MSFAEVQLDPEISWGSRMGPEFATSVIITDGGHEQRLSRWSAARIRFQLGYGVRTDAQLRLVLAFFRARKGKLQGFRVKDWSDYQVTAEPFGTGDGADLTFQLIKTYTSSGDTLIRTIAKPVNGTITLYDNALALGSGYTIAYATGIVTFSVAPISGHILTWTGEFDTPCRFDTDRLDLSLDAFDAGSLDIPVIEIRV